MLEVPSTVGLKYDNSDILSHIEDQDAKNKLH
jgi:chromosome segregation ATPase